MKRPSLFLVTALLFLFWGSIFGLTQQPGSSEYEALRARWMQKSTEEQALLRRRFHEFAKFDPEVQRELRRRAHELTGTLRAMEQAPPPWVRERLADAPLGEREHVLRSCLKDHHRSLGSDLRDRMPADLRARLEAAKSDQERATIFEELFRRGREDMFPHFIERAGKRLDLSEQEMASLRATPAQEREAVLAGLRRRMIMKRGRPDAVDEQDWQAWQTLSDSAFLEQLRLSGAMGRGGHGPGRPQRGFHKRH